MTIGIVNYQVGNLGSLLNRVKILSEDVMVINFPEQLDKISKIILPGVGSFSACTKSLYSGGWFEAILKATKVQGKHLLGICLGMQVLATKGFEGSTNVKDGEFGLNLIKGKVVNLSNIECRAILPHVGWNNVTVIQNHIMFEGIPSGSDFYFAHEYTFVLDNATSVTAICEYDIRFTAAVAQDNIWGTQFHPEKSSNLGMKLLKNFVDF